MLPEALGHKSSIVPGKQVQCTPEEASLKNCSCDREGAGQVTPSWRSPLAVPVPADE